MSDAVLVEAPTSASIPAPTPRRRWLPSRVGVALGSLGIGLVAVALRAYELRDVPRLTDETDEVMRGLAIARGELLPLTNVDVYIGPLWSYLLALGLLVVGPTSLLPRLLTMVATFATVAATAWLGRELYRAVEIVAAAGSSKPVLVDASLSGTRVSTGREGTGVLEYLLILDSGMPVRRYQPNDLAVAVERGEADLVVVSPRLLTRLDKDVITEAPPGEVEARRQRRASFVVVRIAGQAEDRHDFGLVASGRSGR